MRSRVRIFLTELEFSHTVACVQSRFTKRRGKTFARYIRYETLVLSQHRYNTIWPARFYSNPSSPQCQAEFDLYPQQTGLAYQWPRLAKIDWRYSGIGGNAPLANDAVLAFDGGGKDRNLFYSYDRLNCR